MALDPLYQTALEDCMWEVPQDYEALFNWNYSDDRKDLLNLYGKGKSMQWDAETRIDWSEELFEDNPMGMPPEMFLLNGMPYFEDLGD